MEQMAAGHSHGLPQIEIQRESLATSIECTLERLLAGVNQLVALQFGTFDKRLATLGTHMHPGTVCVQVFSHR